MYIRVVDVVFSRCGGWHPVSQPILKVETVYTSRNVCVCVYVCMH